MMEWVREELVIVPMRAGSAADAITQLGTRLEQGGFVKPTWTQAVLEREKAFATGLPTPDVGVAIPHTDPAHVLRPAIAVGVLKEPVAFGEMGNPEGVVPVQIVCALAVAQSDLLVTLLQRLVDMFQTPGVLKHIAAAKSPKEVVQIFQQYLQWSQPAEAKEPIK